MQSSFLITKKGGGKKNIDTAALPVTETKVYGKQKSYLTISINSTAEIKFGLTKVLVLRRLIVQVV